MATVTVKSGPITDRDADPRVKINPGLDGQRLRQSRGTVEITSGNSAGSTYIMCQIPSNAQISDVKMYSDDMGTATAVNVGIYQTTENSNTVVDADLFASALSLNGGALVGSIIQHESAVYGVEDIEKPLWLALGLSSDPSLMYDVVLALSTAADATGTASILVEYTI